VFALIIELLTVGVPPGLRPTLRPAASRVEMRPL